MTAGIHHVTAISGTASRNLDFYTRILGLRLVKRTVNFDDPGTWHLYYGDESGNPGTILTFFPWAHVAPGRAGLGFAQQTAFRVPTAALGFWSHRFVEKGVAHQPLATRFGERVLAFTDPDGTSLALVGSADGGEATPWTTQEISARDAIRGLRGVSLLVEAAAPTAAVLAVLGFAEAGRDGAAVRYRAPGGDAIDLHEAGGFLPGRLGRGTVHHVAFRAADDAEQAAVVARLRDDVGLKPTEQKDRNYFRSVYFREPGGVLFEIATDVPGFAVDEPREALGTSLKLPPFFEWQRESIAARLPPLEA